MGKSGSLSLKLDLWTYWYQFMHILFELKHLMQVGKSLLAAIWTWHAPALPPSHPPRQLENSPSLGNNLLLMGKKITDEYPRHKITFIMIIVIFDRVLDKS